MKKKFLALGLIIALSVSILASCSNNSNQTTDENSGSNTINDEVVEITYWDQNADANRTKIFNKLIEDFELENPNIKVNFVPIPSDQAKSKYDVAIQSNTAPDCGGVSQYWMSDFLVQDALVPLDDYINNWEQKDNTLSEFDKSIRQMAPDGKMYGLAHMVTVPVVWYNKNFLDDAGLEVPTNWNEVFDAVIKTTDKSNGVYGFSIRGGGGSSQQLEQMMYQYSGITDMFDSNGNSTINAPENVEFLEKFAKLYNVYTAESDITNGYTEMVAAFDSASAGMIFHNLGSYNQHLNTLGSENFGGIVELSSVNGKNTVVSNGAICLSVFKDSKHPEEAFKFISYLTEHTASSYICNELGQIPCNKLALTDEWISEAEPTQIAADALLNSSATVTTLPINITGYYDLHQNVLIEGFQNVLLENITPKEYLDNWAKEMTKLKLEYDTYIGN